MSVVKSEMGGGAFAAVGGVGVGCKGFGGDNGAACRAALSCFGAVAVAVNAGGFDNDLCRCWFCSCCCCCLFLYVLLIVVATMWCWCCWQ